MMNLGRVPVALTDTMSLCRLGGRPIIIPSLKVQNTLTALFNVNADMNRPAAKLLEFSATTAGSANWRACDGCRRCTVSGTTTCTTIAMAWECAAGTKAELVIRACYRLGLPTCRTLEIFRGRNLVLQAEQGASFTKIAHRRPVLGFSQC